MKRLTLIYLLPVFLFIATLSLFSTAKAQRTTPDPINLFEGQDGIINLEVGDVSSVENMVAANFTVAFPANFNIDIQPGDLVETLTQGQNYLLQINQNTPEPGLATVALVLVGNPLPTLNQNGRSLVRFNISAPAAAEPVEASLTITDLQLVDQTGQQLLPNPPPIDATINVMPIDGVTVTGTVQRQQLPGPNQPEQGGQRIGLYTDTNLSTPIGMTATPLTPTGNFMIIGGTGAVRVYFPPLQGARPVPDGFLPVVTQLQLASGPPQELGPIVRLAGDVVTNGENQCPAITLEDIMAIARRVGGPPASDGNIYDLNANGMIEANDLLMAAVNFNQVGYVDWQNNNGLNTAVCALPES